ncbi:hypothetical protein KR215_003647 [Drosophila sulfurigaster]|nr:hypothetical protein KR215_003647 [Drosophila sulfurigaster]
MAVWYRLLFFLIIVSSEKRRFHLIFDVVDIKSWAPDLIDEINSTLVQINNRSVINAYLILKRNVDKLDVNTVLDFWNVNYERRRLYNLTMDACRFLTMIHKNNLFAIFSKSFKKHTDGSLKCPLRAHHNYTLKNWYLDGEDFPNFIPEGSFLTMTEYIIHKKKILRIVTRGRIVY